MTSTNSSRSGGPRDPTVQALVGVFSDFFQSKESRIQDLLAADTFVITDLAALPEVSAVTTDIDTIRNAVATFRKFSINNDTVRVVPQQQPLEPYCLLVREMPPTVNESSWLKLFEQSRCADGSACPLPTAARYEHFNNTWVIVFGSEEDVRNAHAAARWLSVDGVQLRARLRIDGKNPYHVPMQQQQHHQQQQQHQQPYMPHPAGFVPPFAAGYGNPGYPMGAPMMPPYGFNPMANGMRPMFPMDMMGAPPPYMMAPPPMVPPFYPYMGEQQFAPPAGSYPYVFAGGQYQRNPNGNGNGRMNRGPGMGSGAGGYGNPYARPYNNNYSRSPVSSQGGQQGRYPRGNYQDGSYQEHDGDRRGERRSNTSADHYRPTAPGLSDPMDGEEADRLPVEGMSLQADDDTQPETQVEVQHPQPEHHHHLAEEASDVPSGLNGESVEEAVSPDAIASVPETGDSTEPRSGERRAKGPRSGSDGQEDGKRDRRRSGDDRKPRASGSGGDAKGTSSSRGSGRRDRSDSTRGERGGRDRKDRDKEKAGDEEEAKKERVPKGPAITLSMEVDFPVLGDSKSSPHPKAATIGTAWRAPVLKEPEEVVAVEPRSSNAKAGETTPAVPLKEHAQQPAAVTVAPVIPKAAEPAAEVAEHHQSSSTSAAHSSAWGEVSDGKKSFIDVLKTKK